MTGPSQMVLLYADPLHTQIRVAAFSSLAQWATGEWWRA